MSGSVVVEMDNPNNERFIDEGASVYHFGHNFLVRCPQCAACARVFAPGQSGPSAKLSCLKCGLIQTRQDSRHTIHNTALDWFFSTPLWLQTPCCGQILWARNTDHLDWLERFVGAKLRERPTNDPSFPMRNKLMASRLPKWFKASSNRDALNGALARLRTLAHNAGAGLPHDSRL